MSPAPMRFAGTMQAMNPRRRHLVLATAAAATLGLPALAQHAGLIDGAGRRVVLPRRVERVFPAGPPAAIQLYTVAPDSLIGWPRANRADALPFLRPGIATRPAVGRLSGRGTTANLEDVLATRPDLIVDSGSTRTTYVELADRVQAQTGLPFALLDGSLPAMPRSFELMGELTGQRERAATLARYATDTLRTVGSRLQAVPPAQRPRVYLARGPAGLETGLAGSINIEIFEHLGLHTVSAEQAGGLAQVSIEQVLRWDPQIIVTLDAAFAAGVRELPGWRDVQAVREGRVHLAPSLPFGWVDFPPGVNRLPGLWWLGQLVAPERFPERLADLTRDFYRLAYGVEPSAAQIAQVLGGKA